LQLYQQYSSEEIDTWSVTRAEEELLWFFESVSTLDDGIWERKEPMTGGRIASLRHVDSFWISRASWLFKI
jgi:hypothetical protein